MIRTTLALVASFIIPVAVSGQELDPEAGTRDVASSTVVYSGSAGQLEVANPWMEEVSIAVDGRLDEAIWDEAPVLNGFTQYDPVEGVPATQRTDVRVLVTDDAIYFGVQAFDDVPGGVRATLADRDSYSFSDDYIRIVLDTFNDQRRAYVIMVNPLGVQQDGLWVEGGSGRGHGRGFGPPIDWNPDFVWDSGGQLYDWGYTTEVRIPLKSLRFREVPIQDWGLQVERKIQRNGYSEAWAPITANVANQLQQFGALTGLRDLDAGLFLEINPVQTLTKQGAFNHDLDDFRRGDISGDFGLNLTYGLTSNLTLDGTYNPDFSQVEADAGQIAVNERFALFFDEKRPFFLEGTEIFNMPKRLVYTRSIVNPVGGAKLTGKVGNFNVGYLGAVDEVDGGIDNPVVNLFRLRRDMGASSNVGMVYTDRTTGSNEYNRLVGLDGRLLFSQRYTLTLLAAGSRNALPDGTPTNGTMMSANLNRSGRNFQFSAEIEDVSNDFDAGSGFIRRTGDTQVQTRTSYNFRGKPGDLIERWGPSIEFQGYWDHDQFWNRGGIEEAQVQLGGSVSFRNNLTLWGNYSRKYFDFRQEQYQGLLVEGPGGFMEAFYPRQTVFQGLNSATLFFWVNTFDRVRGNVRMTRSETPLFDFSTGTPVDLADSWSGNVSLNLFPTTKLTAEVGVRHTSLYRKQDGSLYSKATIPRVQAQYQFSRALFFRTIFEYGSQLRGSLRDPVTGRQVSYCAGGDVNSCYALSGRESNDFSVETLLSYEPTPGTVFFMGYTRQMEDQGTFRFRNVRPTADGFFVKLSYRFRM